MKIALCFSGQPRSYEKGFEYYKKNLLDHYDVDVFIHTWDTDDMDWFGYASLYKTGHYQITRPIPDSVDEKYTNTPDASKWPPRFTVSALYSTFRSMMLKIDQEVKTQQYDWVIKTRSDFALPVKIPFEQLDPNMLYMPPCRTKAFGDWLGNDQFAISSSDNMNRYMSTYLHMDRYYKSGVQMIGEEMLRATLTETKLTNKIQYLNMPEPFPPGPRNGTPHFLIRDDVEQWTDSSKN